MITWKWFVGVAVKDHSFTDRKDKKMGCDIHLVIEYVDFKHQDGTPYWSSFGGEMNPGRDYHMFGIMAGVRTESDQMFEPRGMPEGRISYGAENMLGSWDDEVGERIEDADLHSRSWLTGDEFAQCYAVRMLTNEWGPPGVPWEMVLVTLQGFKERGLQCRVIFAFDN